MIIALVLLLEPKILIEQIQWGIAPTWQQFLYGLAIGTVAYTGIETISNMAEEATRPDKDVPRSINLVIAAVLIVYIGMPLAALSAMRVGYNEVRVNPSHRSHAAGPGPVPGSHRGHVRAQERPLQGRLRPRRDARQRHGGDPGPGADRAGARPSTGEQLTKLYGTQLGSNYLEDPVLGMVRFLPDNLSWLRLILGPWVGILAATILFIATNAGIIGVSRSGLLARPAQTVAAGARARAPHAHDALRGHRLLRRHRHHPRAARGDHAAGGPVRLRLDDLVHGRAPLGHRLRYREPDLERPFRAPLNVRSVRRLRAAHGRVRRHRHVRRVVRHRLLPAAEPPDRLRLDGRGPGRLRDLPQVQGLLAHEDGEDAGPAHEHAGGRRLRPAARAAHRHPGERRDDGAGLPARHRAQLVHRRAVRDRGAHQPAHRRPADARAPGGRRGAEQRRRTPPRTSASS